MNAFCAHLTLGQSQVRAGMEYPAAMPDGWCFLFVCAGQGYLLNGNECVGIESGDLAVIPHVATVHLRASQLGDVHLCHFGMRPAQLTGFFTVEERRLLETVPMAAAGLPRIIKSQDAVARQYAELCRLRQITPGALMRSAMLSLAVQMLRDVLAQSAAAPRAGGPEHKLAELTARVPESEWLACSAGELARRCGCTERHFRRLFAERFGESLKQRQIEWRIERAKKILLESDGKIIEVAGQCGFESLGQFNLTFKRLTRMTPSGWRQSFAASRARQKRRQPPACPRQNNSHLAVPA